MKIKRNYLGQIITGRKQFIDESYGYYDDDGNEHVNWRPEDSIIDSDGFDKRNIEINGFYTQEILLPYGKLICRYGNTRGRITTDLDSAYEQLGLPYIKETVEYHTYRVITDGLLVKCMVTRGRVAPMFNSAGGAVQYKHFQNIFKELEYNKLEEVFL